MLLQWAPGDTNLRRAMGCAAFRRTLSNDPTVLGPLNEAVREPHRPAAVPGRRHTKDWLKGIAEGFFATLASADLWERLNPAVESPDTKSGAREHRET